ncbi:alpha/beta fold hydrolase [Lutispora sp.]|uniref:alpha/beta fold hydrolase n=1 Tax=Lutispora sp. TaxID=2828727 RepID=UPI000ED9FC70|nr:alpha/beta fold hydrolase [Lutispora sp.]MEA4962514.1 alpha/beta fold hydrolase [Lutispora sp.]HCJ57858.1 hypothetical protein [Clostridiaceae bacterium]
MQTKDTLRISEVELGGIPCLYVKPSFVINERPAVIYYHGWESNKENNLFLGKVLAFNGFEVILPDALHHGRRGALKSYNAEALKSYFWRVIFNSVTEYKALKEAAAEKLEINPDRLAVIGSSMGGFIAGGVFASNPEIKCLINMNGACAWEKAEMKFKEIDRERQGLADEDQLERIRQYDPWSKKDELYPRPMLLLHGDSDTSISVDIQRYFFEGLKEVYKDMPERLKFIVTPKLNHYKTIGMVEESVIWLEKYL